MSLRLADAKLRADRCTVMDAVWMSLDRKVVLAAVSRWPGALQYVHDELKADRGIVIAAVSKDGHCLMDAHATLRADFDVVKIAVSESGNALHWASPQLRADVDLMVAAMRDANRDRLKLRDVRAMIRPLMSDVPHIRQAISLIFPPMSRLPFDSWGDFERRLVVGFWEKKPGGADVLANPICDYLEAHDIMRAANAHRRRFGADWLALC